MRQTPVHSDILPNLQSLCRHLRAENLSPKTQETCAESVSQPAAYLKDQGMPLDVATIRQEHVEAFIAHLLETRKPATANNRFRGVHSLFKWLGDEGEIRANPMYRTKPPRALETPPDVLRAEQLKALLAGCDKGSTTTPPAAGAFGGWWPDQPRRGTSFRIHIERHWERHWGRYGLGFPRV